jgi:hypothetical protein
MLDRQADQKMETVETKNWGKPIALRPITALTISQNKDPGLSMKWHEMLVFLYGLNAHRWDCLGGTFLLKGGIFPQSKAFEGAQAFDAVLFLIVTLEPKFPIRM